MIFEYNVQSPVTLKTFLYEQNFSKKTISAIKQDGALLVNNTPKTVRHQLSIGDMVVVKLPREVPSGNLIPFDKPLDILYEDEWLLIVNKSHHQNCGPSREHPHESLVEQVLAYMHRHDEPGIPHIVTRLDRHTMGIVIIAKSRHIHHLMSTISITKLYECICKGVLTEPGVIEQPIARHSESIIERVVSNNGKYAKTLFWPIQNNEMYTLCRVKLETGRTHQIRVHFKHIGHPLVGDYLYGEVHPYYKTQLLKCAEVIFVHPITKKEVCIQTAKPQLVHILQTLS
ncbi:RluA family pseudouridine synthase [Staphylococcus felis]|uniref:RNA pseudouridylate synthase n=1 Tax=Staphylococcus felis TaxID=46127 RepID=A0ABS0QR85_9STAP|nr:RluA family pseudouridine synthase [Staphylococcus felis]MBH9581526.1 RluA family pseudouridine synthase [Staphylococcus felis]MDM8327638.1 RluA family pseudouridine synthase [Staphylococcus felis]